MPLSPKNRAAATAASLTMVVVGVGVEAARSVSGVKVQAHVAGGAAEEIYSVERGVMPRMQEAMDGRRAVEEGQAEWKKPTGQ